MHVQLPNEMMYGSLIFSLNISGSCLIPASIPEVWRVDIDYSISS